MRVFTIVGPSHSGKTTLAAALAELDGGPSRSARLSDAVRLSTFRYLDDPWAAIDIAGGPDNLCYVGPALAASDAAVLCVPPDADGAVLAAPYLRMIEAAGTPCILFVNRMDAATERVRDIISELQAYSRHSIVLRQVPIRDGDAIVGAVDLVSERAWQYQEGQPSALIPLPDDVADREAEARSELLETLSEFDDDLLEQLIEDQQPAKKEVFDLAARVLKENELISTLLGAAEHKNGVTRLMKLLRHESPSVRRLVGRLGAEGALAVSFLADAKKHLGKVVVVRALADGVAGGAPLGGAAVSSVTEIDAKTTIPALAPGQIGFAVKSEHLAAGAILTADGAEPLPAWAASHPPGFRQIVTPTNERDDVRLSNALSRLDEIDPGLTASQDEQTGKTVLAMQGPGHARRLTEALATDYGIEIAYAPVPPQFRETISKSVEHRHRHKKQSGGAGQFADVVIDVGPTERGGGFHFTEIVKGGAVPRNYIPAVQHGAEESLAEGPNGYPVVDVAVTLKDGKHHSVDSSDFAFRTAGKNAVRDALREAGPFVLQPIMKVEIHVPSLFAGGLVPIISGMKGQVLGFVSHPEAAGWDVFEALLPATSLDELFRSLGSATRGTAWFEASFAQYERVSAEEAKALTPA